MLGRCRTLSRHRDGPLPHKAPSRNAACFLLVENSSPEADLKSTSAYLSHYDFGFMLNFRGVHCLRTEKANPLSLTKHEYYKFSTKHSVHVHGRKTTDGQPLDDTFNFGFW